MTLPAMKIWTGGEREYCDRVLAALEDCGCRPPEGLVGRDWPAQALWAEDGFVSALFFDDRDWDFFDNHYFPAYRLAPNGNLVPAEADDDGWVAWHGGECPVDRSTEVEAQLRNNVFILSEARELRWHPRDGMRIIGVARYRIPSMVFPTSQKLEQEADMREMLTEAQALREVAQGYDDGDKNPWARVQWQNSGGNWHAVGGARSFVTVFFDGDPLRRKPRTRRIEGEISEDAVEALSYMAENELVHGQALSHIAQELLNAVQDQ